MAEEIYTSDRVIVELLDDGIGHIRLVREDKRNAVDQGMIDHLLGAGDALKSAKALRCVVLSGDGKAFCAGIDLSMFSGTTSAPETPIDARTHGNANMYQEIAIQFRKLPVPVIAALHGICFGAGLQIAAGADIRVAAPDTRLSIMELKWGIVPDMAGHILWQNVIREDQWRLLTYTAAEVTGIEAQQLGLVTQIQDEPLRAAMEIASNIANRNPDAILAAKRLLGATAPANQDALLLLEAQEQMAVIGRPNQMEAVMSQMQNRKPNYQ